MFTRNLDLSTLLKKKSVLLLGPRGTGKSYYLRHQVEKIHIINLLKSSDYLSLSQDPSKLEGILDAHPKQIIAIDEIQKVPALLDEVHRLIEEKNGRFLLTGSSARKLKAESVNLLAGRAWLARMFPLNFHELGNEWNLDKAIHFGTLPVVYRSEDPIEDLDSYIQTYIEAEIKSEGIIRKIPSFSRFLKTAALSQGELINYQNASSDAGVPASTIKEHYQVLEDTLIGYTLLPWLESKKRKAISTAKFYFFDNGVVNLLSNSFPESEDSPVWGNRFETLIINEIRCAQFYQRRKWNFNYWRSTSQFEVDLIWGDFGIEIKSSRKVTGKHLVGLRALQEEKKLKKFFLISRDPVERVEDNILLIHYKEFLKRMWVGSI
ncbi:MAG: ATP-binding protein [Bdellovibrionales bacterium]|nr:ATP-binding protein [Bdellovibrionales bacterium]